jgi:hypothetical protein
MMQINMTKMTMERRKNQSMALDSIKANQNRKRRKFLGPNRNNMIFG